MGWCIDADLVPRADTFTQAVETFKRNEVAAVDGIAEENAGVRLRHNGFDSRGIEGNGSVLARGSTSKVLSSDDHPVRRDERVVGVEGNMSPWQPGLRRRHAAQRILAELPVLFRNGRVEGQLLCRDDLVGIDVVSQNIGLANDKRLHGISLESAVSSQRSAVSFELTADR